MECVQVSCGVGVGVVGGLDFIGSCCNILGSSSAPFGNIKSLISKKFQNIPSLGR